MHLSLSDDDYSRYLVVLIGALGAASSTILHEENCERPALDWGINIGVSGGEIIWSQAARPEPRLCIFLLVAMIIPGL